MHTALDQLKLIRLLWFMHENEVSRLIYDSCFEIHRRLGPGLYEIVYEQILQHELIKKGLFVERQKEIDVVWDGLTLESAFRIDLLVEGKVLIEIKSVELLHPVHYKQVITYLRLIDCQLGILVNFYSDFIKDGLKSGKQSR